MNIKKGIHHVQHTRPQWYKDYHQWEHHTTLHWITFVVSSAVILIGFFNIIVQLTQNAPVKPAHAATSADTNVTQDVTGGSLSISNSGDQSLTSTAVSLTDQNTTGSLGTITSTDDRGSGVGWSTTADSTNFYKVNAAVKISGSNNTVTTSASSTYTDATPGTYTITIATGGSVGTATFNVSGLETASSITTGVGALVGTKGVKADFASATYVTGDSWTIRVDVIPVTNLQITPGSLTTISGLATNVTAGSVHTYSTTSDEANLITASAGYGLGSYSVAPDLQLTVPANSYANSYTATVVETIQ